MTKYIVAVKRSSTLPNKEADLQFSQHRHTLGQHGYSLTTTLHDPFVAEKLRDDIYADTGIIAEIDTIAREEEDAA